jgi:hypothetical protein
MNRKKPKTMDQIADIWYDGYYENRNSHYHHSRYHFCQLHSLFNGHGTIEFRGFNSADKNGFIHAGRIRAYIQLSLAMSHQALIQSRANPRVTVSTNEKYTFRTFLLRLGLIGDEFKTARKHLLDKLEGNIAWKNPEDAIRQRKALLDKRREAALTRVQEQDAQPMDVCEPKSLYSDCIEPELESQVEQSMNFSM